MTHLTATQGTGLTILLALALAGLMMWAHSRWPKRFDTALWVGMGLTVVALPIVGLAMLAGWVK